MKNTCFIFLWMFSFNLILNAQTNVVLNAIKDNTIYGNFTTNSNGAGDNFTAGTTNGSHIRRALLQFDFSGIPPGATITAATLTLVMNRTIAGTSGVSLHRLNESWGEGASDAGSNNDGSGAPAELGDATWLCRFADGAGGCMDPWGTNGGVFQVATSATTAVTGPATYTWSSGQMVTDIQNWVNSSVPNFGWIIRGNEGAAATAKRFASRTNPQVPDRPTLSVTYTTTTPITLLYFKAQAQNSGSKVSWKTAQEVNNDFFEIDFSTDAVHFTAVGKVKGAGNSSVPQLYNFTHYTPQTGKVFYRLSQTDFNRYKTYSQVEMVDLKKNSNALLITPNPVVNKLVIPGVAIDGKQQYSIINAQGVKIAEGALLKQEIMLPNSMAPGLYMLRILHATEPVQSAAFIKY